MFRRFCKRVRKFFRRNNKVHPLNCTEAESSSHDNVAAPQEVCQQDLTPGKDFLFQAEELTNEDRIENPIETSSEEAEIPIETPVLELTNRSLSEEWSNEEEAKNPSYDNVAAPQEVCQQQDLTPGKDFLFHAEELTNEDRIENPIETSSEKAEIPIEAPVLELTDRSEEWSDEEEAINPTETAMDMYKGPHANNILMEEAVECPVAETRDTDVHIEECERFSLSSHLSSSDESSEEYSSSGSSDVEPPMVGIKVDVRSKLSLVEPPEPLNSTELESSKSPEKMIRGRRPSIYESSGEDFCFLSLLGEGSYGKVFLAEHKYTKKRVALKAITKDTSDPEVVEDIKREREIMELVKKEKAPFLLGLITSFESKYNECLVMDCATGGDLYHLLKKYDLPLECTRFYAACIVLGLKFLHEKNIVHRDLKPENILLDKRGYPLISDYGLSITGIGFGQNMSDICGTQSYMAPELFTSRYYTRSVDWWALGVIIYKMIFGKLPFDDEEDSSGVQFNIMCEMPKYPLTLPAYVRDILQGLLTKTPALRLGSTIEGAHAVMERPFFYGMDWEALRRKEIKPMFIIPDTGSDSDELELGSWKL